MAGTEWSAFLDDDDAMEIGHVAELVGCAQATGADVVYPGCTAVGAQGQILPDRPEWGRFGQPFDPDLLRRGSYIPVTSLARTGLARQVGGFRFMADSPYDDHTFYLAMLDAGARFEHLPLRTWVWHQPGPGAPGRPGNTSGQPDRW
jgi:hypothetical protein